MSIPTTPCCTAVLNQQQEEAIKYHNQCSDAEVTPCKNTIGMCTTVENGRVVVKPVAPAPIKHQEPELS